MTFKKFLLKKYPKSKYDDCPVPKQYWSVVEEYAGAANDRVKVLEGLLSLTESQRKEWADMCIEKEKIIQKLTAELNRSVNPPNNIDY